MAQRISEGSQSSADIKLDEDVVCWVGLVNWHKTSLTLSPFTYIFFVCFHLL